MMTRQAFLAAFDADRWLTGPSVLDRLEQSGFWDAWWRQASQPAKLANVANVCWRTQDENGLPFIVAIDRHERDTRTFMYKPCAALTPDEYLEAHRYFSGLARYERRAADIAEALALRWESDGVLPQVDADPVRLISVRQFWMQKKAEGWATADGLSDEDILQELEQRAQQWEKDQL